MSKNTKKLIPKLRFPEFQDSEDWNEPSLSEVCERITEKVGDKKLTTVSITAGTGFVSQAEKFSRDISGNQYRNYIVLNKGEYSFNKGNSKRFPQGCIYKLKEFDQVAAPNAFISFRFKKGYVGDFFQGYFECNRHGEQLKKFISSGARSDGLLNINADDFFTIKFPAPSQNEQQKIADCLSSIDDLITAQTQKVEALKTHKKGLMQQLFPRELETVPRLRFTEFRDAGEWKETQLSKLGELVSGLTYSPSDVRDAGLLVLRSSNVQKGEITLDDNVYVKADIKGANLSKPNDILICVRNGSKALIGKNAMIPEDMPLCTHGAFMTVFRALEAKFVFQLFQSAAYQKQVDADLGATINSINGSQFLKYKFFVPSPNEQQKIADFLSSIDNLITAQNRKLEALKTHKKGLMQQLFPGTEANSE